MFAYSVRKKIDHRKPEYSVWKPGDELALGLGQVERDAVRLGDSRDEVEEERDEAREG